MRSATLHGPPVPLVSQIGRLWRRLTGGRASRCLALTLYVLASAGVGFAHRPASLPLDLSQYTLPDGTIPIICGGQSKDDGGTQRASKPPCDACCLTHAPGLPPHAGFDVAEQWPQIAVEPLAGPELHAHSTIVAAHGPRGPPAI
jgi:hypothetical protein